MQQDMHVRPMGAQFLEEKNFLSSLDDPQRYDLNRYFGSQ